MRRMAVLALALAVCAVGCAQAAPEREVLPTVPTDLEFPLPSTTLVPEDGSCVVTTSNGVLINEVTASFDAARVLEPGDLIVGLDDLPVTNQSTLFSAMRERQPGDEVDVLFVRDEVQRSERVVLGSAPEDPERPMIGVIVRNSFETLGTADIPPGVVEPGRLVVSFGEGVYAVDVVTNDWVALPFATPLSPVVEIDGELLVVSEDRRGVETIDGTDGYQLAAPEIFIVAPLGTLGANLLYSIVEPDEQGGVMSSGVVSTNFTTNVIEWIAQPPDLAGTFPVPVIGYAGPTGDVIAVTHRHERGRLHTLYDADGTPIAGWGSDGPELASAGSLLAGWLDERRFVSVAALEGGGFEARVSVPADPDETIEIFVLNGVPDIVSIHAVTGTDLLVVGSATQTLVFDLVASTFDTVTRNCGMEVLGRIP